jgi:hypothetical protein
MNEMLVLVYADDPLRQFRSDLHPRPCLAERFLESLGEPKILARNSWTHLGCFVGRRPSESIGMRGQRRHRRVSMRRDLKDVASGIIWC